MSQVNIVSYNRVVIEDNVFLEICSIILKWVSIGKNCVTGARSVVTKNISDGEIWAGNPVKFIRKLEKWLKELFELENMKSKEIISEIYAWNL